MAIKTRLITEIGTRAILRRYWGNDCPNCYGTGKLGGHNATIKVADSHNLHDNEIGGNAEDYPNERWPTVCDHCGALVPDDAPKQLRVSAQWRISRMLRRLLSCILTEIY